jgi:hypothetical protein
MLARSAISWMVAFADGTLGDFQKACLRLGPFVLLSIPPFSPRHQDPSLQAEVGTHTGLTRCYYSLGFFENLFSLVHKGKNDRSEVSHVLSF